MLLALAVLFGAQCTQDSSAPTTGGRQIKSASELKPDASPGDRANLIIADIPMEVTLLRKQSGEDIELTLQLEGETIEVELYKSTPKQFSFVGLGFNGSGDFSGDIFKPAIPLLKFPMTAGDSWDWSGENITSGISRPAKAKISTSLEGTRLKVVVDLELDSGGPTPAKRPMSFWFEPDRGVIRREFGSASSNRMPTGDLPAKPEE